MNKQIEVSQKGLTRHSILCIVEEIGPNGASTQIIKSVLAKNGVDISNDKLLKELKYLENKDLIGIKKVENAILKIDRTVVYITAKGQDLLDGFIKEDGIEVGDY